MLSTILRMQSRWMGYIGKGKRACMVLCGHRAAGIRIWRPIRVSFLVVGNSICFIMATILDMKGLDMLKLLRINAGNVVASQVFLMWRKGRAVCPMMERYE